MRGVGGRKGRKRIGSGNREKSAAVRCKRNGQGSNEGVGGGGVCRKREGYMTYVWDRGSQSSVDAN